jgi:hypothetical protein
MTQFVAINKEVEVSRTIVLSTINSMDLGVIRLDFLKKNNISLEKEWINLQDWLNAFNDISNTIGEMNLFLIGKEITKNTLFPPIKNLEDGLKSIDIAYHMNHRLNGRVLFDEITGNMIEGIGNYKLVEYNTIKQTAVMVCNNPNPSKFDEGIIVQVVKFFKPIGTRENIELDITKETRINGGNSCTYLISW